MEIKNIQLYNGNCLEIMDKLIEAGIKVDLIITDPPYQKTKNKWDYVIPFDDMWNRLKKLRKDNTPIILFGQGIFSAKLILSNEEEYRYSLIWNKEHPSVMVHPTQKPVELLEYLIKTYSNEKSLVLDFTMGSGSTGIACKNLNRNFIGIEIDKDYFKLAINRLEVRNE